MEQGVNPENKDKYFVMERLGVSLNDVIRRNSFKFSLQQVVALGCQLVDAFESLHSLGYIHCDLKSDNILMGFQKNTSTLK